MAQLSILDRVRKAFAGLRSDYFTQFSKSQKQAAELDYGVLTVAMMVAALDGRIEPKEWAAFRRLADVARTSAVEGGVLWDSAVRAAGYILVQSQILTEKQLVYVFVREVEKMLPEGYASSLPSDLRRAFVMWESMAISDGDFSGVERKCLNALRVKIDEKVRPTAAFMLKAASLLAANDMKALSALVISG